MQFAAEAQLRLAACDWGRVLPGLAGLKVRMGMHTGEPLVARHPGGSPDYLGPAVNRAAQVAGAGHGCQVIVSEATRALSLAELPATFTFLDLEDPAEGGG